MLRAFFRKSISFILSLSMLWGIVGVSFAADTQSDSNLDYQYTIGDGVIQETVTIDVLGKTVYLERTSYEAGTAILDVVEDGATTTFPMEIDYETLLLTLTGEVQNSGPTTRGRVDGYSYLYLTTDTMEEYYGPEYQNYATIAGAVSTLLSAAGFTGLSIAAAIAQIIFINQTNDIPTKIIIRRNWYQVTIKGTDDFVGYHCECIISVYEENDSGRWVFIDSWQEDYETLTFG